MKNKKQKLFSVFDPFILVALTTMITFPTTFFTSIRYDGFLETIKTFFNK